jgi:ankyrin repeat protein
MLAAYNGHTGIVERLLEEGGDVNKSDINGRTPLIFAASGPFPETVELLLQADSDPNATDSEEGWSALMFAAAEGHRDVVQKLLEYGADVSLKDKDGDTAIDFASNNNQTDVVELLKSR